jgi:hypothetical protein
MIKEVTIHHHLGLGDHIICNGLVRFLAEHYDVELFCKNHNLDNIKTMYRDNNRIKILGVNNDFEADSIGHSKPQYIRLGVALNGYFPLDMDWAEVFYYQVDMPYDYSWKYFYHNKTLNQNIVPLESYAFLCNCGSDSIDGLDYGKINPALKKIYSNNGGFFDNIDVIQNATEIHCINSSYIHLIDRIEIPNTAKLFYHKNFVYRNFSDFALKKNWTII